MINPEWETDRDHRHLQAPGRGPVQVTALAGPADAVWVLGTTAARTNPFTSMVAGLRMVVGRAGWEVAPGTFGENLTIGDLERAELPSATGATWWRGVAGDRTVDSV